MKHYNFALVEFHYSKDADTGLFQYNGTAILSGRRVAVKPPVLSIRADACPSSQIIRCFPFNDVVL